MDEMRVADIVKDKPDLAGTTVDTIYKKQTGEYAIYGTAERVMVHFADDPEKRRRQNEILLPLAPLRGEINALIDGWRKGSWLNDKRKKSRALAFDRRTADALVVALDGNAEVARDLLTGVKADILDERTSIGRVEYLFAAAGAAVLMALLAMLLGMPSGSIGTFVKNNSTHLAVQLGCLGAFFSTAIGIRNRQVRTDLQRRDNMVDAGLRILIGAISAVILFSILKSGIIGFTLGSKQIDLASAGENDTTLVHTAIVVAFLAGFSERLVGDLLTSRLLPAFTKDGETPAPPVAGGPASAEARASATALAATATAETGRTAARPGEEQDGDDAHDQHEDGCLCDAEKAAIDMTDDRELPPATGGVQKIDA